MGLLDELPKPEQFTTILSGIIGDEGAGTGVAGVMKLLGDLNPTDITANLDSRLSAAVSLDVGGVTGGALAAFESATQAASLSPETLLRPLTEKLEGIQRIATTELTGGLLGGTEGTPDITSLLSASPQELLAGVTSQLDALQKELTSGAFGELRQWGASVTALEAETAPLLAGDAGTAADRLIAYLGQKNADIVAAALPGAKSLADQIGARFDAALSNERIASVGSLKSQLIAQMNQAQAEFAQGNFTNTASLAAAQASLQQLTESLNVIGSSLQETLNQEAATADGLTRALQREYAELASLQMTDLSSLRAPFTSAFQSLEQVIDKLDFSEAQSQLDKVFGGINDALGSLQIGELPGTLTNLQAELQTLLDDLSAGVFEVVATVRTALTQVRSGVQTAAEALGSYDSEGHFQFHVQREIEEFLNKIKGNLDDILQPILTEFVETVRQTLEQVSATLNSVQSEVESVKTQLQSALEGVNAQLQQVDVAATMEQIRQKLEGMLSELGAIDFDPIVDPVVTEINEMRDQIAKIDLSALNDFLIAGLKAAVQVLKEIDFSRQITDALLKGMDEILQLPKNALQEIETKVEGAIAQVSQLEPGALLQPLQTVFDPVREQLDKLQVDSLAKSISDWYSRTVSDLDNALPTALLQPVIDVHQQLMTAFESLSPEKLIQPIEEKAKQFLSELQKQDVASLAGGFGDTLAKIKQTIDSLSPDTLFAPLGAAFDKIAGALDSFDPGAVLAPFTRIFDQLAGLANSLTEAHLPALRSAFAALIALPTAFDPKRSFEQMQQRGAAAQSQLQQLNIGRIMADLKAPYDALNVTFQGSGGSGNADLAQRVAEINPMRNEALLQRATDFQQIQDRLRSAFPAPEPPAELLHAYEEARPKLEALIPAWANDAMTPASIKQALQEVSPAALAEEITQLYTSVKAKFAALDPRALPAKLNESFSKAKDALQAFDPQALVAPVQTTLAAVEEGLDKIDLHLIVTELQGIADDVKAVIAGLDPRPILEQLQSLAGDLTAQVSALNPGELLKDLDTPFQAAKSVVAAFDPASFAAALQGVYQEIKRILDAIDIGVVLQPFSERLTQLRSELETGLKRVETAFNGMIAAIPV